MLEARGLFLLGLIGGLAACGLLLDLPSALLVAAGLAGVLAREVTRLRRGLARGSRPWGLQARLDAPRTAASTRNLERRSQRVGQRLQLQLEVDVGVAFTGASLEIVGVEATEGLDVVPRTASATVFARAARGGRQRGAVLDLAAVPLTAAVHRVHGVRAAVVDAHGLVRGEVFLPCPYEVAVLPRSLPLALRDLPETRRHARRAAVGNRSDQVAGQGDELRELREHMPGDPFKHIAWKASARRGRLMSRSFEHERARALFAVLDTGATMRWGALGRSPLDAGLDLAHSLAEGASRQNLPFGLCLVDGDVVERQPTREGLAAVQGCDRALLDVRRAVSERQAPVDEGALLDVVARYLRAVEGVALPQPDSAEAWVRFRQRTVMAALARLPERERLPALRGPEPSARADLSILRRFCRAADLALPYRHALAADDRVAGLVAGIRAAMGARRGPFVVVVASDFLGLRGGCDPLWQEAGRARKRGHRVLFVSLGEPRDDAVALVDAIDDVDTARGLAKADLAARTQLLDELRSGARRAGAAFLPDPAPEQLVRAWASVSHA